MDTGVPQRLEEGKRGQVRRATRLAKDAGSNPAPGATVRVRDKTSRRVQEEA